MRVVLEGRLKRRRVLAGLAAIAFVGDAALVGAQIKDVESLRPGEYTWHPERQEDGPVAVIVSIPEQRVYVYRNGIRIAVSTCSTGREGHETPTGVFVVLQKDQNHHSSTYDDAPMPYMNRLTWSGIALHAGNLPGYPASHGCVRLPLEFSEKLFTVTHLGTPVIIAGTADDPSELTHPGMVLSGYADDRFRQTVASLDSKTPQDWTDRQGPVLSVIASSADRSIMMLQDETVVAQGQLTISGSGSLGSHVFVLKGGHGENAGLSWFAIAHDGDGGAELASGTEAMQRMSADQAFLDQLHSRMHPGMMLVVTDLPLHPDSRTGKDFVIMS